MKKGRKLLAIVLIACMALTAAACNADNGNGTGTGDADNSVQTGGASGTGNGAQSGSYEQVTFAYATFNNIPSQADLAVVEEAINVITREKIGAEIKLRPIFIGEYSNTVRLALQGGEKLDIFQSLGDFNNCVATDMAYDITELLDAYASETRALIGDDWLAACTAEGSIFGIPTYKPIALTPMGFSPVS